MILARIIINVAVRMVMVGAKAIRRKMDRVETSVGVGKIVMEMIRRRTTRRVVVVAMMMTRILMIVNSRMRMKMRRTKIMLRPRWSSWCGVILV